jgi:hypothetical protein
MRQRELTRVRTEWKTQAIDDIKRQVQNRKSKTRIARSSLKPSLAQTKMLNALNAPLVNDLASQFERRDTAVAAIAAYCVVQEPASMSNHMMQLKAPPPPREVTMQLDPVAMARSYRESTYGKVGKVERCFVCVAVALTLPPDDVNLPTRTRPYYNHHSLKRHFIKDHLEPWEAQPVRHCPICVPAVIIFDKAHFQNHAEAVHGIKSLVAKNTRKMLLRGEIPGLLDQ